MCGNGNQHHVAMVGTAREVISPDGQEACIFSLSPAVGLKAAGVKAADCLDRNDAYGFFEAVGDLVVTGPTHTNVNDFRAMLVL